MTNPEYEKGTETSQECGCLVRFLFVGWFLHGFLLRSGSVPLGS